MNNGVVSYPMTPTPTSKKPKVPALKRWDIPFTSLELEQNSVQAPDRNSWARYDYPDQSWGWNDYPDQTWGRDPYSDESSTTNFVVNVFKPFTNKKSGLTKHIEQYRKHSITTANTTHLKIVIIGVQLFTRKAAR